MTGISVQIDLREAEARDTLRSLLARLDDRRPFFEGVAKVLESSVGDRFRTETDPDGKPWAKHAPSTIRARLRNNLGLNILKGNTKSASSLAGTLNTRFSDDEARIGSPLEYAAIHQMGGVINKPASSRWMVGRRFAKKSENPQGRDVAIKAHSITIPARPFLGLTRDDEDEVMDTLDVWLSGK